MHVVCLGSGEKILQAWEQRKKEEDHDREEMEQEVKRSIKMCACKFGRVLRLFWDWGPMDHKNVSTLGGFQRRFGKPLDQYKR